MDGAEWPSSQMTSVKLGWLTFSTQNIELIKVNNCLVIYTYILFNLFYTNKVSIITNSIDRNLQESLKPGEIRCSFIENALFHLNFLFPF